jgi:tetratricopeptide (TPR) repeat protein
LGSLLAVASTLALACAAWAIGIAYHARRGAAEQARLSQQFGQEVQKIAAIARYSAFLPLHDTRREMDTVREQMQRLREWMRVLGPIADGPGHHALGRGWLALERWDDALKELEAAWATGYRSPELANALGVAHGKLYERALAALEKTGDPKVDATRRAEIARAHRDPALRYLKEVGTREAGGDAREYVEGLMALYEQRFDEALALARKAGERVSWLFEARILEGDIHYLAGKDRNFKGDLDGALEEFQRAGESYRAATAVAHSSSAALMGECHELLEVIGIEVDGDRSPEATVRGALAACTAASTARPDDVEPFAEMAQAWYNLGEYQSRHGVDPTRSQEEAIRAAEHALAIDANAVRAHEMAGLAYHQVAEYRLSRGGDPRDALDRAMDHLRRALEIDPRFSTGYGILAIAQDTRGDLAKSHGEDPRPWYRAAIASAEKELTLIPEGLDALNQFGISHYAVGAWELGHGLDPSQDFARSVKVFEKIVRLRPKLDYGYANLCQLYRTWGEAQLRRGDDPRDRLAQATGSCERAIAIDDNYSGSHQSAGGIALTLAAWQLDHGEDLTPTLAHARAELERTLAIDASDALVLQLLAQADLLEARGANRRGRDPGAALKRGEAHLRRAVALHGGESAETLRLSAELHLRRAEWQEAHGRSTTADVRDGRALIARAMAQDPGDADSCETAGALEMVAARTSASGHERAEALTRGRAALERALKIDVNLAGRVRLLLDEARRLSTP